MKFLSLCSGIEAASVAWHDLGFECVGVSEIEKFPSEVLKYHYPSVPNLGDMTKFKEWNDDLAPDLLVGGTPCQSFSIAGLRKGMDDPRGNLALTYVAIAEKYKPRWFVWENVPGVLSSNGGKDFASFLSAMANIGYGIAYRVLDAQFFGVPQRRRRVFVVGYLGDWRPSAAVLFESSSVFGNTPKGRKARKETAASAQTSPRGNGEGLNTGTVGTLCARDYKGINADDTCNNKIVIETNDEKYVQLAFRKSRRAQSSEDCETWVNDGLANTLNNFDLGDTRTTHTIVTKESNVYENHPTDSRVKAINKSSTVTARWGTGGGNVPFVREEQIGVDIYNVNLTHDIACTVTTQSGVNNTTGPKLLEITEPIHPTLTTTHGPRQGSSDEGVASLKAVFQNTMRVRRLTPVECERLQGFPDNWTQIPYGKKPKEQCPDGHRYKSLGNSMAVPVMRWIGRRIKLFESLKEKG
jgi:DNA (cytosine-5)-methyltransferase 1